MGTALLILAEIFAWGLVLLLIGALIETGWSRLRRRSKRTVAD